MLSRNLIIGFITLMLLTGCGAQVKKISNIPEASGIDFCKNTGTLVVANDEGTMYEIKVDGTELGKSNLGDYDLEGVVCTSKEFIFAVEDGFLLFVNRETGKKRIEYIDGFRFSDSAGIEGIAMIDNDIYVAIQTKKSKNARLLQLEKSNSGYIVHKEISSQIKDSSGLTYFNNKLYVLSDKKNLLYTYSFNKHKKIKVAKFPEYISQEGIAFDGIGNMFIADDNGGVHVFSDEWYL